MTRPIPTAPRAGHAPDGAERDSAVCWYRAYLRGGSRGVALFEAGIANGMDPRAALTNTLYWLAVERRATGRAA